MVWAEFLRKGALDCFAVNLVCGNLQKPCFMVMASDGFKNRECTQGVVLQKHVGVSDASVHMCFSSNVNDGVHLMNKPVHKLWVANVAFDEGIAFIVLNIMQISGICANAYLVNVNQFVVRVLCKHIPAKVASDES